MSTDPGQQRHDDIDAYGAALGNALRGLSAISQDMHWLGADMGDEARLQTTDPAQLAEVVSELQGLRALLTDAQQHTRRCRKLLDPDIVADSDIDAATT